MVPPYQDLSVDTRLQDSRGLLLLLARFALLDFRGLARRWQTYGQVCYLQHGERREDAEERWDGVGDNVLELVCIHRQDEDRMHMSI
jgi:hypothetical protein